MSAKSFKNYCIRPARPNDYDSLGQMTVDVYQHLPGMPGLDEQPDYYAMLRDVEARTNIPTIEILVAATAENELLGGVTFIGDMQYYGSGGTACAVTEASGIRLLAVKPEFQGRGIGRALTEACLQRAKELGRTRVVLHTTDAMQAAWRLYQQMGFLRSEELDFMQGELAVYGFMLSAPVGQQKTVR